MSDDLWCRSPEFTRTGVNFTLKQIEMLEKIVSEGKFGNNKAATHPKTDHFVNI